MNAENKSRLFGPSQAVEAGPWRLRRRGDELSDIEYRGRPVLRAIRAVVRDHDWRTLSTTVDSVDSRIDSGAVAVTLALRFTGYGAAYGAELSLRLCGGEITVGFDGVAPSGFRSNRIGLVVLHRTDDAGRAIAVRSPDGAETKQAFPVDITPHQPFMNVADMQWERDGSTFELQFSGDTFETEDQRNWTDASFKTYSTPLARPFPITVTSGDRVNQSIRLTAVPTGQPVVTPPQESEPPSLTVISDVVGTVPALGTSSSFSSACLSPIPGLDALLVEVSGDDLSSAAMILRHAMRQADELDVPLDIRIAAPGPDTIAPILDLVPMHRIVRLGAFHTESHVTEPGLGAVLRSEAQRRDFAGTVVTGARSHFTELNRRQDTLPGTGDAITYSITPQMHSTEVSHVVETLPIQRQTALNALRIAPGQPLHIGPITLKARFNAVSTDGVYDPETSESMKTDPLQGETFTAAWMLGSVAALTLPGVESVSYFEASGARGLINDAGEPTPALHLLAKLSALHGADVLAVQGSVPGLVLYPVKNDSGVLLFAANLTAVPLHASVKLEGGYTRTFDIPAWSTTTRPLG